MSLLPLKTEVVRHGLVVLAALALLVAGGGAFPVSVRADETVEAYEGHPPSERPGLFEAPVLAPVAPPAAPVAYAHPNTANLFMTFLVLSALLALVILAGAFVAALAIRLFTKRRPPLCTRRAAAVATAAVFVIAVGQMGYFADDRRHNALTKAADELVGERKEDVESRLGPPERRFPAQDAPRYLSFHLGDKAEAQSAEIWTYRAGVWYSWYQPSARILLCFDNAGRCIDWSVDD